ncbi:MAG TPA: amino acid--[acyl-carrier-protein] ligase [Candidatus Binataceae bacterium]|nr:amino acid--[acyl-carrier-protein] ligase [Candidatus Binataceae bacterium]
MSQSAAYESVQAGTKENRANDLGMTEALLVPVGVNGVYARTALFEQVVESLSACISGWREPETEVLRFPPVMSRAQLERSGYHHNFPHLLGCVSSLEGDEASIHTVANRPDWSDHLAASGLVLSPAACYPVYPLAAARGFVPPEGLRFDVASYCFRHEATHELGRLQSFQMREYVCIGKPETVLDFRERWIAKSEELAGLLGLSHQLAPASDPFFGRAGRLAALSQLQRALKFEMLIPVRSEEDPTACMSFNYHLDHFSAVWQFKSEDGEPIHSGCAAFGIDRLALALFAAHGIDTAKWPRTARVTLSL